MSSWHDLGLVDELKKKAVQEIRVDRKTIALTYQNDSFGAVSGHCNHAGGLLGEGSLDGEFIVCPWHYWKFHRSTGLGEPGFEEDKVPCYALKIEAEHLWIDLASESKRNRLPHAPHPLSRPVKRESGSIRIVGISTTAMDPKHPRYSTSEALLSHALDHAQTDLQAETRLIHLSQLQFRACEGFYSKSARACTWPCSITQMDSQDQMEQVYEALVHWADVVLIASPIRWGGPSSLYFKMIERMNCIQNQITIANKELIKNKVAGFIITGGQDNVQAVAGEMLGFFAELGFVFPPFPYIAHSRGWSAEDMEQNVKIVKESAELREAASDLARRSIQMAKNLLSCAEFQQAVPRGGRKAHRDKQVAG